MILVYLQIAIHINAVGLGAMTLLAHATWLLAQLLLTAVPWIFWIKITIVCLGNLSNLRKGYLKKKHILRNATWKPEKGNVETVDGSEIRCTTYQGLEDFVHQQSIVGRPYPGSMCLGRMLLWGHRDLASWDCGIVSLQWMILSNLIWFDCIWSDQLFLFSYLILILSIDKAEFWIFIAISKPTGPWLFHDPPWIQVNLWHWLYYLQARW